VAAATNLWFSVAPGSGLFVAVGDQGEIMSSPDCVTWTERNPGRLLAPEAGITGFLSSVAYGGGLFVAVGEEPTASGPTIALIATSSDGITWTQRDSSLPANIGASLDAVAYGNGRFVAAGFRADGGTNLVTSTAGVSWTTLTPFATEFVADITHGNGTFVA